MDYRVAVEGCAEIRTDLPWARVAHALAALKAVRYLSARQSAPSWRATEKAWNISA
jgi:hypothetical protein